MVKDKRYATVKKLISNGLLTSLTEIFDTIPKSVIARDLGMNNTRFTKMMKNVELFILKDIYRLAFFLEVDELLLLKMVHQQHIDDKENKKRK